MTKIEEIISKAVNAGIEAGRSQAEKKIKNVYKATEIKLYALPVEYR